MMNVGCGHAGTLRVRIAGSCCRRVDAQDDCASARCKECGCARQLRVRAIECGGTRRLRVRAIECGCAGRLRVRVNESVYAESSLWSRCDMTDIAAGGNTTKNHKDEETYKMLQANSEIASSDSSDGYLPPMIALKLILASMYASMTKSPRANFASMIFTFLNTAL